MKLMKSSSIPEIRIRRANSQPVRPGASFVLYWMTAFRRTSSNFSLDRSIEWAHHLRKPLVIFEPLRCDYPWASDRLHRFLLDAMAENARALSATPILYYPYVEPAPGAAKGLLAALASHSCLVVTDDFPCFFLPRMLAAAARQLPVLLEAVDSNGLLPLRQSDRAFSTAHSFRRFLQKNLEPHLLHFPNPHPLSLITFPRAKSLPRKITSRWPPASPALLNRSASALAKIPIDHSVPPVALRGGASSAQSLLKSFLRKKLSSYSHARNEPSQRATSELSPYLHFGHISAHQIFTALVKHEKWSPSRIALRSNGSRSGWWGLRPAAESFLDQLITWRELGFNFCLMRPDYDHFNSLPPWALRTLRLHRRDPRSHIYSLHQFERALTHDPLWNAAQTQLLREGRIHNYLRMLWGKKILEWTRSPAIALKIMLHLNNKYALDDRDPNSYSGIFWCFGRFDRPWGPERPVFGTVRFMSSANTARKFPLSEYLQKFSPSS
jgi:deoxyribodipyrimidine photo-lyase